MIFTQASLVAGSSSGKKYARIDFPSEGFAGILAKIEQMTLWMPQSDVWHVLLQ